jgi:hypothetical protein
VIALLQPDSIEPFVAATKSVLTMRFPINSPGDPYATAATTPQITSIVSLLSLPAPAAAGSSTASLSLQTPLHTPLAVITALLPQLLAPLPATLAPAALRASASDAKRRAFLTRAVEKKVVVLVPVQGNLGSAAPGLAGLEVAYAAVRSAVRSLAAEVAAATTAETSRIKVNVMEVGFVSTERTVRPIELVPRLTAIANDWAEWWMSWVRGRRQPSGFEVLEQAVGRCVGVGGRWAPRFSFLPSRVGVWRVGAGCKSLAYAHEPLVNKTLTYLRSLPSLDLLDPTCHPSLSAVHVAHRPPASGWSPVPAATSDPAGQAAVGSFAGGRPGRRSARSGRRRRARLHSGPDSGGGAESPVGPARVGRGDEHRHRRRQRSRLVRHGQPR